MKLGTICETYKTEMMVEKFTEAGLNPIVMDKHPYKKLGFDVITTFGINNDRTKAIVDEVTQYYIDNPPKKK